ncbi:hypothetical protein HPB48_026815 [Haemaphysalis longicornis]|uniref:Uncharacterized protein n=1 Tax=Haemaphysalis longicornis TaxID=44386 RepID=A0A9J6HCT4_HAELO|nr:hypothetical protein HPB48_026815 [Haemaphysalis longicornis]
MRAHYADFLKHAETMKHRQMVTPHDQQRLQDAIAPALTADEDEKRDSKRYQMACFLAQSAALRNKSSATSRNLRQVESVNADMPAIEFWTTVHKYKDPLGQGLNDVGLNDVLRGEAEQLTPRLEEMWKGKEASLVVCSIPEVTTKGREVQAKTVLVNEELQAWCRRSGARFLDLAKVLSPNGFTRDGVRYSHEGGQRVARAMAEAVAPFLEKQRPPVTPATNDRKGGRYPSTQALWRAVETLVEGLRQNYAPTANRKTGHGGGKHGGRMPKDPKEVQEGKTNGSEKIAFLNMNGGRTERKWEEIYRTMEGEKLSVYAVVETHFREAEGPGTQAVGAKNGHRLSDSEVERMAERLEASPVDECTYAPRRNGSEAVAKLGFEIRSWALGGDRWYTGCKMCMLGTGERGALATKYKCRCQTLNDLNGTSSDRRRCVSGFARLRLACGSRELGASRHYGRTVYTRQRSAGRVSMTTVVGVPLLFEARSGTLRTAVVGEVWQGGGKEEESLEHVVLECKAIQPHQPSGTTLERALGFGFSKPPGGGPQASEANGGGDDAAVDIDSQAETTERTKRRLENWFAVWKKRCGVVG